MSPALAVGIVAEIQPRDIRAGESTNFTYGVRAEMTSANPGFDRFEVMTGSRVDGIQRVELVDELPRNATGKVLKYVLRDRL